MQKVSSLVFILFVFFAVSCDKSDEKEALKSDNLLLGIWVNSEFNESHYTMERATEFNVDADGFIFEENGNFTNRANCGFCGTPPVSYCNYEGFWEEQSDAIVLITVEDWSGEHEFPIEIISVSETLLEFKYVISEN